MDKETVERLEVWDHQGRFEAEVEPLLKEAFEKAKEIGIPIVMSAQFARTEQQSALMTLANLDGEAQAYHYSLRVLAQLIESEAWMKKVDVLLRFSEVFGLEEEDSDD